MQDCDYMVGLKKSTNYQQLLRATCGAHAWAYDTFITDELVAEFPETDLNAFGIYSQNVTLVDPNPENYLGCKGPYIMMEEAPDPGQTLLAVSGCVMNLTLTGSNICNLYAMGNCQINATISDKSKLQVFAYGAASIVVVLNNDSILYFESNNDAVFNITNNNNGMVEGELRDFNATAYTGNNTSHGIFMTNNKSALSYTLNDTATVDIKTYDTSTVINTAP